MGVARTSGRWASAGLVAAVAVGLAACDPEPRGDDATPPVGIDSSTPVGEVVVSWSTLDGEEWVWDMGEVAAVLSTERDRRHWLESVPAPLDPMDLRAVMQVDLETTTLVVEGGRGCGEGGGLYPELVDDRPILRLAINPEPAACGEDFTVVRVWAVGHEQTGGAPAFALSTAWESTPSSASVQAGTRLGSWDENWATFEDLTAVLEGHSGMLRTAEERDALADAVLVAVAGRDGSAVSDEVEPLEGIDMSDHVLVVVGFHRCTQASSVRVQADRSPALLWVQIEDPEPMVLCDWSPLTIDVWAVPTAELEAVELGQYRLDYSYDR